MPLEMYYVGDKAFADLASAYMKVWKKCSFKEDLIVAVDGDVEIAVIIFGHFLDHSMNWLENKVPALDELTPKECMKTENGIKRLKTCLMRMPC